MDDVLDGRKFDLRPNPCAGAKTTAVLPPVKPVGELLWADLLSPIAYCTVTVTLDEVVVLEFTVSVPVTLKV